LRADEEIDYLKHRPGLELYFDKGKALAEAQPLLDKLDALGFQQFTFAVDPVRTPEVLAGKMGDVVGLRYVFTPEFALREPNPEYGGDPTWSPKNLTDDQIRDRMITKSKLLVDLAKQLRDVEGVSFVEKLNYEADVYFWGDYDDALGNAGTRLGASADPARWQGQQIRSGLERADRRREQEAWAERSRGAGIKLGILMRQVKIKPEHIKLERDRKTVDGWDVSWAAKEMLLEVLSPEEIAQMMADRVPDVRLLEYGSPQIVQAACYALFLERHPGAILARNHDELKAMVASDLERVIVVESPSFAAAVLASDGYNAAAPARMETVQQRLKRWVAENPNAVKNTLRARKAFDSLITEAAGWVRK
jgi:uncharacterized protein (DUF1330 family)